MYKENGKALVVVSEGIHYADGSFVSEAKTSSNDGFGHVQLGGLAVMLAAVLHQRIGAKVRGIELSLLQRAAAHQASATDIAEAEMAGRFAVESALSGVSGKMAAFGRDTEGGQYRCVPTLIDLEDVANREKTVPTEWINAEGNFVTEDFINYALPLIKGESEAVYEDGLPRYAKLKKVYASQEVTV